MSLRSCPECGSPVAADADLCPRCGATLALGEDDGVHEHHGTDPAPLPSRRAQRNGKPRRSGLRLPSGPLPRRLTILAIVVGAILLAVAAIWGGSSLLARSVGASPTPAPTTSAAPDPSPSAEKPTPAPTPSPVPTATPSPTVVAGPITLSPAAGAIDMVSATGNLWCRFSEEEVRCAMKAAEYEDAGQCSDASLPAAASLTDAGVAFPCVPAVEFPFSSPVLERDVAYVLGDVQCLLTEGAGVTCFRPDGVGFQLGAAVPPVALP